MWRRRETTYDLKRTKLPVKHSVGMYFCLLMTTDTRSTTNGKVYRAVLSAEIQPNAAKLLNQPKSFSRKRNETLLNEQVSHLISTQRAWLEQLSPSTFSVTENKTEGKETHSN